MDLSKLSDDELMGMYQAQPPADPRADMPAQGAQAVTSRVMPDVGQMSDQQLMALHAMPAPTPPSTLEAAGRGAAQGATFGFADEVYGLGGGVKGLLTGNGFQAGYDRARDYYREGDKAAEAAHPYVSTGAKVVGNVAGMAPAMVLAPGAMGLTAATLGGRVGLGAASGAGLGAIQGLGEGEGGLTDQAKSIGTGMLGGGVFGGAAPAIGQAVGKMAAPVLQRMTNRAAPVPGVGNAAADMLVDDFNTAGGTAAITSRLQDLGPEARLYHAAPTFEGSAQGLAIRPETREALTNDVRGLRAGSNDRLAAALDNATFPAPVPSQVEAQFAGQRARLGPLYGREEANARPLDPGEGRALWDLADGLAATQKGTGRQLLDQAADLIAPLQRGPAGRMVREPDLTPEGLMGTRRSLDGLLARVEESTQLQREGVGSKLQQLRQAVDDQVRAINPDLKNLDRAYETSAQSSDAFGRGLGFMNRDVHPVGVATQFNAAPMEQQAAERLGARARIDREVGNTNRDLVALRNIVKSDGTWNRDKLTTYFGDEAAGQIFRSVDREAAFEEAARRLVDNSQTAQRTEAAARFRPRGEATASESTLPLAAVVGAAGGGPTGAIGTAALAAAVKGVRGASLEAKAAADIARNRQIADILMLRPGPELDQTLNALGGRANRMAAGEERQKQAKLLAEILARSQGNEVAQQGRARLVR